MLAELLAEVQNFLTMAETAEVKYHESLEAAFAAFDSSRRERTQWLVTNSRIVADLYEWRQEECGSDIGKIEKELSWRAKYVWDADVNAMVKDAKKALAKRLEV